VLDHTHQWEGRTDHVEIFDLVVDSEPTIEVDNREVVSAEWLTPGEALERRLFRPLAQVLEARERSS
jgi:hypothetical protein